MPHNLLGTRASLMLDVVFIAMFLVVPVLCFSVFAVRSKKRYGLHKKLQLILGAALLTAVLAFEVDMRLFTDWEKLAEPSPYYTPEGWSPVWTSLAIHLSFAVPTTLIWIYVIAQALRKFPDPPRPSAHSFNHKRWGWIATIGMVMTAVTGWIFYYLAFAAV